MFNIEISDKVKFQVKGSIIEDDKPKPFSFSLTCKRLDVDEYKDRVSARVDEFSMADFVCEVAQDWGDVRDGTGSLVPFSDQALRSLLKVPGMAYLIFKTYGAEVGVKEKN